jgi:hypothetical protein
MRAPSLTALLPLAVLLAVPLFAARADAVPPVQPNPTSFEDISPNSLLGEIIFVGVSPDIAELGGDAFAGRVFVTALYHTGVRSWMVQTQGTGVIEFPETEAAIVEFWVKVLFAANDDTVITAFDAFDVIVDGPVTIIPGTGWHLVTLTGSIARVDVVNFATDQINGIDDFSFTVPEPSALTALASGIAMLALLYRRRREIAEE